MHQHPREQQALELAGRHLPHRALGEAAKADGVERFFRAGAVLLARAPEGAEAGPHPLHHDIAAEHREGAIHAGLLRQQRHAGGLPIGAADRHMAFIQRVQPRHGAQQRGLARAIRPDDGRQAAGRETR